MKATSEEIYDKSSQGA